MIRPGFQFCAVALLLAACCFCRADNFAVPTFHYDNQRLGWDARETLLTPADVDASQFGRLWSRKLDGDVAGSPLYVPDVKIDGRICDVVYAATTNNSVYALDSVNGQILWGPVQVAKPINDVAFVGSGDLYHPDGILSTPAIDLQSRTIYVCALFQPKIQQQFGVWALDIATGTIKRGWPVILHGSYLGCKFDGGQVLQRGALLDSDGWLYIPFGARQDRPDWHGWIVGVDTRNPSKPLSLWSPDPHAEGGGIWGVGGPSTDKSGRAVYIVTGNGGNDFERGGPDLGQCVIRMRSSTEGLVVHQRTRGAHAGYNAGDVFMPSNVPYLNDTDEDLGGGGAVILPRIHLGDHGVVKSYDLVTTGGKEGVVYLLDAHALGGVGHPLFQKLYFGDPRQRDLGEIRAVPAYFQDSAGGSYLIYPGEEPGPDGEHGLVCLKIIIGDDHKPALQQMWTLSGDLQRPASPVVSSDETAAPIVWITEPDLTMEGGIGPGVLHAYDALTGRELYDSNQNAGRDALAGARKFSAPVVVNGKVYIGVNGVDCYGELPEATSPSGAPGQ